MHTIAADAGTRTVRVTLAGTMSPSDVDAYMSDLQRVLVAHRLAADYGIVIDVTACTIQTRGMMEAMGRRMAAMPRARSVAIVSRSQLARLQIRRLFTQAYARCVCSVEEGLDWVVGGIEPPSSSTVTTAVRG